MRKKYQRRIAHLVLGSETRQTMLLNHIALCIQQRTCSSQHQRLGRYHYCHFTDGESEAPSTDMRSHHSAAESGLNPRVLTIQHMLLPSE